MTLHTDILLVTATEVEFREVIHVFEEATGFGPKPISIHGRIYHDLGIICGAKVMMVQSEMGSGSLGATQQTVQKGIEALSPSSVVLLGIAFGIDPKKQSIGEVLVSKNLLLYELQRVGTKDGELQIISRGDRPHASPRLINHLLSAYHYWENIKVHFGLVLSGEKLIDNFDFRQQLLAFEPEAIGGEMEGAGLYVACQDAKVDWILVKAICDWADGDKSQDKTSRQQVAAHNAAAFVLHALQFAPLLSETNPREESRTQISAEGKVIYASKNGIAVHAENVIMNIRNSNQAGQSDEKESKPSNLEIQSKEGIVVANGGIAVDANNNAEVNLHPQEKASEDSANDL